MKKLALSFLLCAASAFAVTVDYSTAGTFASSGTNVSAAGVATITFMGAVASVNAPTFSSLGTFDVTATAPGTFVDSFTLTITQTVPSAGAGASSTSVLGVISGNSSGIELSFSPSSVAIGEVTYVFAPNTFGLTNPQANGGETTVQAHITAPIPEPASLGLLGSSLLGFGFLSRRFFTSNDHQQSTE
jgi:PEP-CTERM motif